MNLDLALVRFDTKLRNLITETYETQYKNLTPKYPTYKPGKKYIKVILDNSCWGFISKVNGNVKGSAIKVGDLLKAANYSSPAKHARGNIIDGTASYTMYGPSYLK